MCVILAFVWMSCRLSASTFVWPEGKRAAISVTFDDGRDSQLDVAMPILNRYGIKATFYVVSPFIQSRIGDWKKAVLAGHEIGNHTMRHPGSGNFFWAKNKALEDYTLSQMAKELDEANMVALAILGIVPQTYAYTCGQKFVGRGQDVKSYVPLVAQRFIAGRGWLDEAPNDPSFCDLAQVTV